MSAPPTGKTVSRDEILEAAEYLMTHWAAGHLGHQEDIGGATWSLNDAYQALAYSLARYDETGKFPDEIRVKEVMGPVDYPMYNLRTEPAYNTRTLRGGWKPYQIDKRDFPPREWLGIQGLPGNGHGSYQSFIEADPLLDSIIHAVDRLDQTGSGRKYTGERVCKSTGRHTLLHAHRLAQRRPDLLVHNQSGIGVQRGRFAIQNDQLRAVLLRHNRKICRGIHDERRSNREKQIAL